MALKIDAKFEEKLACASKNDMRNLATFYQSTQKSQNWDFYGIFWSKVENVWAYYEEFDEVWPEHSKISKICTLIGCFWAKYMMFELKEYRGVMFDGTKDWCKI